MGMQGALLSLYIEPIYFKSMIVGSLFNEQHVTRAVYHRVAGITGLPDPYVSTLPLLHGVSMPVSRAPAKSPNMSLNWTWGDKDVEIVDSRTGKLNDMVPSRVCKQCLFQNFLDLWDNLACEELKKLVVAKKLLPPTAVAGASASEGSAESVFFEDRSGGNYSSMPFSDQPSKPVEASGGVKATPPKVSAIHMRRHCNYKQVKMLAHDYSKVKDKVNQHFDMLWGSSWINKPPEQDEFTL